MNIPLPKAYGASPKSPKTAKEWAEWVERVSQDIAKTAMILDDTLRPIGKPLGAPSRPAVETQPPPQNPEESD